MSTRTESVIVSQETRIVSSIRAARAALGWAQPELARRAGVSLVALARLESGMTSPRLSTVAKIKTAIEAAGVRIADDHPAGGFTLTMSPEGMIHAQDTLERAVVGEDAPEPAG